MAAQRLLAGQELGFDWPVPDNGYRWWYVDAFSDDGSAALTIIVFIGSVFSPYYFSARRRGNANPRNFCSINTILYGPDRRRWSMTERGANDLATTPRSIAIGPSRVDWLSARDLRFSIDERCTPFPTRLSGQVDVELAEAGNDCFALDRREEHRWWPIAPQARVKVNMANPGLSWCGSGYLDSNAGTVPLEQSFTEWHWQRSELSDGRGSIFYDSMSKSGESHSLSLCFDTTGRVTPSDDVPENAKVAPTPVWRAPRRCRIPEGQALHIATLEDSPFYARSKLSAEGPGGRRLYMHESLHLRRFRAPWMQALLPFRMPRRASAGHP
ncbi:MAG: carotenoid 1,2-hydratase [Halieaceae bacterium]|jgi:carotenoid 1,2-hydratase